MNEKHLGAMVAFALSWTNDGFAEEYWVEPGAPGNGTKDEPFAEVGDALEVARAGDVIWLGSGDYGELSIDSAEYTPPLTISALDGATPSIERVRVSKSKGLTLSGLHLDGESAGYLVELSGNDITIEDCTLMSVDDTSNWSAQDWIDRASNGISVSGTHMTVRKNYLLNVGYGISSSASDSLIEGNVIENFSRDGLRGLGDHTTFQYNTVKNCYDVDDHHDDGFQSWSVGEDGVGTGEVTGVILRGNTFIAYSDPDQPHRGTLQGIGCFDGTFVDWVVENNVVMTDHWHGITLLGARDSSIVNNTVIDLNEERPGPPWISIDAHKDGTEPTGCEVSNNLTTDLSNADSVAQKNNIEIAMSELDDYFVDPERQDLHLRSDAPAIDVGTPQRAPGLDRDGISRPQGKLPDVGAYEWHDGSKSPSGGTPSVGGPSLGGAGSDGSSSPGGSSGPSDGEPPNGPAGESGNAEAGCACTVRGKGAPNTWSWGGTLLALLWMARRKTRREPR